MPPKLKIPAPIDRPLSRAYLREFKGWSTAYPPGVSEPTTLRRMDNMMVNRDGSLRIRPGLKYLSYMPGGLGLDQPMVGTHEAFFLNDGSRAYLFAVREDDSTVGFRVATFVGSTAVVHELDDAGVDFELPAVPAELNFTADTTYVKYLQIDNKIFALSDAGEAMRLFYVGSTKVAKRISSIERPDWTIDDKLTVVHPDAAWIESAGTQTRRNLVTNPSFETNTTGWTLKSSATRTKMSRVNDESENGSYSLKLEVLPERTNLMTSPLHAPDTDGLGLWANLDADATAVDADYMKVTLLTGAVSREGYAEGPVMDVVAGTAYRALWSAFVTGTGTVKALLKWYDDSMVQVGATVTPGLSGSTQFSGTHTAPAGATKARLYLGGVASLADEVSFSFRRVAFLKSTETFSYFSGDTGTYYYWSGAENASASVYATPATVEVRANSTPMNMLLVQTYRASVSLRADDASTGTRSGEVGITWLYSTMADYSQYWGTPVAAVAGAWSRADYSQARTSSAWYHAQLGVRFQNMEYGEIFYVDSVMLEQTTTLNDYVDGSLPDTSDVTYSWSGAAHASTSSRTSAAEPASIPPQEAPTTNTLISSDSSENQYNYGFFYTFANEVGESAASQITVIKGQRSWTSWEWETPNAAGEPSGTETTDPSLAADQLVAYMPEDVFDEAVAQGAVTWQLYMFSWSNQDSVPVEGTMMEPQDLTDTPEYQKDGWIRITPQSAVSATETAPLPAIGNLQNFSDPSKGGQGLVAADRMVVVHDPTAAGVIRWTSSRTGEYLNFSSAKGGGYKTLSSGNLFVPACVKLWQNPQSVDTLTILCLGVDGYSASYYMAPGQVTSQSDAVTFMAFEETTATPGTVAPYGNEVLNNALYHPIETELVKSTASNYNINHKSMTELISNMWGSLLDKDLMVSSQLDNRLYYIVHNRYGAELEAGCRGNEIWVCDTGVEGGTWSRWTVQALSLRKVEVDGRIVMSVVRPDGIFCLDPFQLVDEYVTPGTRVVAERPIPWSFETNTQGANRSHDAWAHLQQVTLTLGNFLGELTWGVKGWDQHGKPIDVSKVTADLGAAAADDMPFDIEDHLQVRRDMKEWHFYAASVGGVASSGQISLVQYRYTPVSVNVGYEYGSVETFEYGGGGRVVAENGVPIPVVDPRRP